MVKAQFSNTYHAVRQRVLRLPSMVIGGMKAQAKRDARNVVKIFRWGIINNRLHLKRLKPDTVNSKERSGMQSPATPLLGVGEADPRTYVNMLEVANVGNRMYSVRPKPGFHYPDPDRPDAEPVKLSVLFDVHEYGTTIANGFGRGIVIRIPPRPALRYAFRRYMAERAKADPAVKVRAAIAKYVREGDAAALARIARKLEPGGGR
jgi:hypothetical protein